MNKEEIWNKTRHFKLESDIGNFDLIDVDYYLELLNKYDDLQCQLKEKEKVINQATEFIKQFHINRDSFKWNEQDYIDTIEELEKILKN